MEVAGTEYLQNGADPRGDVEARMENGGGRKRTL